MPFDIFVVSKAILVVIGGIALFVLDRRIDSDLPPFTPIVFLLMVLGGYYYGIDGLLAAILVGVCLDAVQLRYAVDDTTEG